MIKKMLIGGIGVLIAGLAMQLYKTQIVIQWLIRDGVLSQWHLEYATMSEMILYFEASGMLKNLSQYQTVNMLSLALVVIGIVLILGGSMMREQRREHRRYQ